MHLGAVAAYLYEKFHKESKLWNKRIHATLFVTGMTLAMKTKNDFSPCRLFTW